MTMRLQHTDYRIEEHTGLDGLGPIRFLWEHWQAHPNADFDFFSTIIKSRHGKVNPVVLVVFKNDAPVALAACRKGKDALPISFGYLKISRSTLLQLTVVYGGLTGVWDEPAAMLFIRHLRQMMRRDRIDVVHLPAMRSDHPVYKSAHLAVPFFLRNIVLKNNLHWCADLPDTFDAFLKKMNRKHRAQLRSNERKLAEHYGGSILSKIFRTPEEVSQFCSIAENIAQRTYLRGLGVGFYDNEEMRNRLDLAARKGWMRGHVLYANEKPCAFWLGTLFSQTFYLDYTGFDSNIKDFAPGQILFIKMIEALCSEGGINGIDFGFGDAEYKQRFGNRNWEESDLYIFNNTPVMVMANLAHKSVSLVLGTAEKTLKRYDLFSRIKNRWRLAARKSSCNHRTPETENS